MKQIPDPELLRKLLSYDPLTGHLYWLNRWPDICKEGNTSKESMCRSFNTRYAGTRALTRLTGDGYFGGSLMGRTVKAHRVAWAIHTGNHPNGFIDHINGQRGDNRFSNLRVVSPQQNVMNSTSAKNSRSKYLGVTQKVGAKKWIATITYNRKQVYLGTFEQEVDAALAYNAAAKHYFGEYSRQNSI